MKIDQLLICFLVLFNTISFAQEIERVEVNGRIIVDRNDVEGVTVYNHSSQTGTVTDEDGNFVINVAINDRVEFGALQFQNFTITITEEIITSKEMTVHLVEKVNALDEVVILPYGLTGNLEEDAGSVQIESPNLDALYFGLDNLDKIEFAPDHLTGVKNIAMEESRLVYGFDPLIIIGSIVDKIFSTTKKKEPFVPIFERKSIMSVYSMEYIVDALDMKEKDIPEFIYYVEENDFDLALLEANRELDFLNYLNQKKEEFFNLKNDRN
ncbi:carboxypeptidase-like regulatory domain-containing protein [Flavobacteriaceae sp. LMIT009]